MKKKYLVVVVLLLLVTFVCALSACVDSSKSGYQKEDFKIKLYDNDWNEITDVKNVDMLYNGEPFQLYNAIAYCKGKEFARIDIEDKDSFRVMNPLTIFYNNTAISTEKYKQYIDGEFLTDNCFFDIRYDLSYSHLDHLYGNDYPDDIPKAPQGCNYEVEFRLHISDTFDYRMELYDQNGDVFVGGEITMKYDGTPKMLDARFYAADTLRYSYQSLGSSDQYYYRIIFSVNNKHYIKIDQLNSLPVEMGSYEITYTIQKHDSEANGHNYRDIGVRHSFTLHIVE